MALLTEALKFSQAQAFSGIFFLPTTSGVPFRFGRICIFLVDLDGALFSSNVTSVKPMSATSSPINFINLSGLSEFPLNIRDIIG